MKQEEIIAKAWKDPNFKKRLLENPKATLEECGYHFPENVTVKAIENSTQSYTFVLPASPSNVSNLSEAEMFELSGAGCGVCTNLKYTVGP
jgi:hypothetical protein